MNGDWLDNQEYEFKPKGEEARQEENDRIIAPYFAGTLAPKRKQIIKKLKEDIKL